MRPLKALGFWYIFLTVLFERAAGLEAPWLRRPACWAFGHTWATRVSDYYVEPHCLICGARGGRA